MAAEIWAAGVIGAPSRRRAMDIIPSPKPRSYAAGAKMRATLRNADETDATPSSDPCFAYRFVARRLRDTAPAAAGLSAAAKAQARRQDSARNRPDVLAPTSIELPHRPVRRTDAADRACRRAIDDRLGVDRRPCRATRRRRAARRSTPVTQTTTSPAAMSPTEYLRRGSIRPKRCGLGDLIAVSRARAAPASGRRRSAARRRRARPPSAPPRPRYMSTPVSEG